MAKQVSVRLEEHEVARLDDVVAILGVSRSVFLRQAINVLLDQFEKQEMGLQDNKEEYSVRLAGDPLRHAQELMYDAWEAPSLQEALALARKALAVSEDCADAYSLLAEATGNPKQALELYQKAVAAGERALGKAAFKEDKGHFWGLLETRPYMRARSGLAHILLELGNKTEAAEHYFDMLQLNPNDNQGIRYCLLPLLIEMGKFKEAEKLYENYKDDGATSWQYSRALSDFIKAGDSPISSKSLAAAIKHNAHVPKLLLDPKKIPHELPGSYQLGSFDEACLYAVDGIGAWEAIDGALEWLADKSPSSA